MSKEENTQEIIVIDRIENLIRLVKEYAEVNNNLLLPHCKIDLTFDEEGYSGTRVVYWSPDWTASQEGRLPSKQFSFSDLAKDFDYFFTDTKKSDLEMRKKLKNEPIQRIFVDATQYCGTISFIRLYFEGCGSYVEVRANIMSCPPYEYREKGWGRKFKLVGTGSIFEGPLRKKNEGAFGFIRDLHRQLDVTKTELSLIDSGTPVPYEGEINLNDLIMYWQLKNNGSLDVTEKVQLLVSEAESSIDTKTTTMYRGYSETKKGEKRVILPNRREIRLSHETYEFLSSKEGQEAINFLRKFYQQAEAKYGPLLENIAQMNSERRKVA